MKKSYTYDYPMFCVCVDIFVHFKTHEHSKVLLIQRGKEPFKDEWALPGGHVEINETCHSAALRELKEETGLELTGNHCLEFVDFFDRPNRDPSQRKVSFLYYWQVNHLPTAIAGDDAYGCTWMDTDSIPVEMAFDHREMCERVEWYFNGPS